MKDLYGILTYYQKTAKIREAVENFPEFFKYTWPEGYFSTTK